MEPQEYPAHRIESADIRFKEKIKTPYIVYVRSTSDPELHIEAAVFTNKPRALEYVALQGGRNPVLIVDPNRYL